MDNIYYKFDNDSEVETKNDLYDYEESNVNNEDKNSFSYIIKLIVVVFGLFIISLLLNICDRIKDFNQIAGYVSIVIAIILFIYFYIKPILSIYRMHYFESGKVYKNSKLADAHNRKTRRKIAEHIINFTQNVKDTDWYDLNLVQSLKNAVGNGDDKKIYEILTELMNHSIKDASNGIIIKSAVQSGLYSALVPNQQLDAILVAGVNFKMVRDLLFLYGFRPSNAKLAKIFLNSIVSSLAAYGLEGSGIGSFLIRLTSRAFPVVTESSKFLADAGVQAITNGTISMWIGYKAIDYLKKDYKLQIIIKDIDVLDDDDEFNNTRKEVVSEIETKLPSLKDAITKAFNKKEVDDLINNDVKKENKKDNNKEIKVKTNGNKIILPFNTDKFRGKNFVDVQKQLLEMGFSADYIAFEKVEKGKKKLFEKEGAVIEVLFGGVGNIEKGVELDKNTTIIIRYVTYGYYSI